MELVDRIMLYALVRGLRPSTVLEIGVRNGSGARIIASALQDNDHGQAVGIDPAPELFRVPKRHLHGRYLCHTGFSPEATPIAVANLNGKVDLLLIDALHTGDARYADFQGALPFLSDGAHIIFHGAYHQGVASAVDQIIREQPEFHDLGVLTRHPQMHYPVCYQGFRILRKGAVQPATIMIEQAYRNAGQRPPPCHPALRNFDDFANRIGQGADLKEVAKVLNEET